MDTTTFVLSTVVLLAWIRRGQKGSKISSLSGKCNYVLEHIRSLGDYYDKNTNPQGSITLSIAENGIAGKIVQEKLNSRRPPELDWMKYGDPRGRASFRESIVKYLEKHVVSSGRKLNADALFVVTGCTAALEVVVGALCKPSDTVMIPTPYFPGFDSIQRNLVNVCAVRVPLTQQTNAEKVVKYLSGAYAEQLLHNRKAPRCLLLTSPHNPTGIQWTQSWLESILEWAQSVDIHVIVDEVYALSTNFSPNEKHQFWSVLNAEPLLNSGKLHVVSALSKDFGICGLRCGYLYTESLEVQSKMGICHTCEVSGDTQMMLQDMLTDEAWLDEFVLNSRKQLFLVKNRVIEILRESGINTLPHSEAGIFVLLDLRPFLKSSSFEAERGLWHLIVDRARVNLTPGENMHMNEPGWFRMCFAYHEDSGVAEEAAERLVKVLRGDLEAHKKTNGTC